ncbi:hypothetical protein Bhyg_09355 [Pseudolycoriella hygida]|uniref:Uncharacterized protein n=1 Tax=Pseudolycoriella hygida TaxID=35572 RepID=A0A9Q0N6A4_9DIPT|nr:hypothetical protein Bhyg_09355 [Pseudolycoriella hygida]
MGNSNGQTGSGGRAQGTQGNAGQSSGGQKTTSGWQAGYEKAYADACDGINRGETWGYGGGSSRFGEGYMRGHQETYGDKGA